MAPVATETSPTIEWAWAGRALLDRSGDLHVVAPFPGGALVALLDGLGHGPEAADASAAAAPVLTAHAEEPVLTLIQRCHEQLRGTRGVVMSLASFRTRDSSMSWSGVGNVSAVLLRHTPAAGRRDEALATRGGVVGFQLPPMRADTMAVSPGDVLVLATDGIRELFASGLSTHHPPQEIAESVLLRFAKSSDDAHVVVARYVGGGR
jgi:negative regulator of sigma-B (phosphoserine phosphatase)